MGAVASFVSETVGSVSKAITKAITDVSSVVTAPLGGFGKDLAKSGKAIGEASSAVARGVQDVIMTAGDVVTAVGKGVEQTAHEVSNAADQTARAVGQVGRDIDKGVRENIPGGWVTVGAVALTVATAGAAGGLAAAGAEAAVGAGAAEAAAITAEISAGVAAGTFTAAEGAAMAAAVASTASTVGSAAAAAIGTAMTSMGTGALIGAGVGAASAAITGKDVLQGALNGAVVGGASAGLASGFGQLASAVTSYAGSSITPAVASRIGNALAATTKALASGADPATLATNLALNTSLAELGKLADIGTKLDSQVLGTTLTGAGTGALGSLIKGGDAGLGALSGALGSAIQGGLKSLDLKNLTTDGTITPDQAKIAAMQDMASEELAGIRGETSTDIGTPTNVAAFEDQTQTSTPYMLADLANMSDAEFGKLFQGVGETPIRFDIASSTAARDTGTMTDVGGGPRIPNITIYGTEADRTDEKITESLYDFDKAQSSYVDNVREIVGDTVDDATVSMIAQTLAAGIGAKELSTISAPKLKEVLGDLSKGEITAVKEAAKVVAAEVKTQSADLNTAKNTLADSYTKLVGQQEVLEQTTNKLNADKDTLQKLVETNQQNTKAYADAKASFEANSIKLQAQLDENAKLQATYNTSKEAYGVVQTKLNGLMTVQQQAQTAYDTTKTNYETVNGKMQELVSDNTALKSRLESLSPAFQSATTKMETLFASEIQAEKAYDSAQAQMNSLTSNNKQNETAYNNANSAFNTIKANYLASETNVKNLYDKANASYTNIQSIQNTFDTNKAAYLANNGNTAAYDAANAAADSLNTLIPAYNTEYNNYVNASSALDTQYANVFMPAYNALKTAADSFTKSTNETNSFYNNTYKPLADDYAKVANVSNEYYASAEYNKAVNSYVAAYNLLQASTEATNAYYSGTYLNAENAFKSATDALQDASASTTAYANGDFATAAEKLKSAADAFNNSTTATNEFYSGKYDPSRIATEQALDAANKSAEAADNYYNNVVTKDYADQKTAQEEYLATQETVKTQTEDLAAKEAAYRQKAAEAAQVAAAQGFQQYLTPSLKFNPTTGKFDINEDVISYGTQKVFDTLMGVTPAQAAQSGMTLMGTAADGTKTYKDAEGNLWAGKDGVFTEVGYSGTDQKADLNSKLNQLSAVMSDPNATAEQKAAAATEAQQVKQDLTTLFNLSSSTSPSSGNYAAVIGGSGGGGGYGSMDTGAMGLLNLGFTPVAYVQDQKDPSKTQILGNDGQLYSLAIVDGKPSVVAPDNRVVVELTPTQSAEIKRQADEEILKQQAKQAAATKGTSQSGQPGTPGQTGTSGGSPGGDTPSTSDLSSVSVANLAQMYYQNLVTADDLAHLANQQAAAMKQSGQYTDAQIATYKSQVGQVIGQKSVEAPTPDTTDTTGGTTGGTGTTGTTGTGTTGTNQTGSGTTDTGGTGAAGSGTGGTGTGTTDSTGTGAGTGAGTGGTGTGTGTGTGSGTGTGTSGTGTGSGTGGTGTGSGGTGTGSGSGGTGTGTGSGTGYGYGYRTGMDFINSLRTDPLKANVVGGGTKIDLGGEFGKPQTYGTSMNPFMTNPYQPIFAATGGSIAALRSATSADQTGPANIVGGDSSGAIILDGRFEDPEIYPVYQQQAQQQQQQSFAGGGGVDYTPNFIQGETDIDLQRKPPRFKYLHGGLPQVTAQTYAEGGHVPEFYSEGGLNNRYVTGNGDGTSDDVPAMLANGEFVIPADVVSSLGNGSNEAGSNVLDELLQVIRSHKQNHDPKELPPDSLGPLAYLNKAMKKAGK